MACASLRLAASMKRNGQYTFPSKILNVITSKTFRDVYLRIFTVENKENVEARLKISSS